jgi:hypothetical protein
VSVENSVGPHTTYFEEPDIIFMKAVGYMSVEDGTELLRRQTEFARGRSHAFFLIDMTELEGFSPEVRRRVAEMLKDSPLRGMASYGASLKARVAAKLIITAINLFSAEGRLNPMHFVATESEARAWIARRRVVLGVGIDTAQTAVEAL